MVKKAIVAILVIIFVLCGSIFTASAQEIEYDYRNYEMLFEQEEYDIILRDTLADSDAFPSDVYNGNPEHYDSAYKVYKIDNVNFLRTGQGSVKEMISNEYMWMFNTHKSETVQIELVKDVWTIVGVRSPSTVTASTDIIDMSRLYKSINTIENVKGAVINEIIFFESWDLCGNYVYIATDTEEYLVPFSYSPDWTGLKNGSLYTAKEAQEILYKNLDIATWGVPGDSNEVEFGGAGGSEVSVDSPTTTTANQYNYVKPAMCAIILVIVASSMLFFIKKKKA